MGFFDIGEDDDEIPQDEEHEINENIGDGLSVGDDVDDSLEDDLL